MKGKKESILSGYPHIISYDCHQKISEQMTKNICKIKIGGEQGTGFFCKIPFPDLNNMLPVLITNNHIINSNLLYKNNTKISMKTKEHSSEIIINLNNRKKYTDEKYDITIIELKEKDNIKNFLDLDEKIIYNIINNSNENDEYIDETVYIIQYPEGQLSVSYGVIETIFVDKRFNFSHKCCTRGGSSGSPILNLKNKIIGIHKKSYSNKYNKGTFINYPIKEFIQQNYTTSIPNNGNIIENNMTIFNYNPNLGGKKLNTIKLSNINNDNYPIQNNNYMKYENFQISDSGLAYNNLNQNQIFLNHTINFENSSNQETNKFFQTQFKMKNENPEIELNTSQSITILFIRESMIESDKRNISITCGQNEKVAKLIEKYRNKTNDWKSKRFIFNVKNLNDYEKSNMTLSEVGIMFFSKIYVS